MSERERNGQVLVWDLETVPDHDAVARAHGLGPADVQAIRDVLGSRFPRLPYHRIVCIGLLAAERQEGSWRVSRLETAHAGRQTEADLIAGFGHAVAQHRARLVSYNGHSFDMPVLRYRALINRVPMPALAGRAYFHRYSDDALDLCDVLAGYETRNKVSFHELSRALDLPGKPEGVDGGQVAGLVQDGRIEEVAAYCESDVLGTYRMFLVHELFRGGLTPERHAVSEADLERFLQIPARPPARPGPTAEVVNAAEESAGHCACAT